MADQKPIYLDYHATTPVDPRVTESMLPFFTDNFGNSASSQHMWGWTAHRAVEKAREFLAQLIGAKNQELVFTSGATEGNNWVLQSLYNQWRERQPTSPFHVISSPVEHSSIMKTLDYLKSRGAEVDLAEVNSYGQVQVSDIEKKIKPHTRLISLIWANNEVGTLNPIAEIGELAHQRKIYFHTDATQAVGKIPIDLSQIKVDFLTLSAHKIYGPKGVGGLYIRSKEPRIVLQPLIFGGGHERGLRSGTVNVPGVVGLGAAAQILQTEGLAEKKRLTDMRDRFLTKLSSQIDGLRINGHPTERIYNNMSLTFQGRRLEKALPHLVRLGFSTGSACHSGSISGSHVLKSLGFSGSDIDATLRLSLGRFTTEAELDEAAELLRVAFSSDSSDL